MNIHYEQLGDTELVDRASRGDRSAFAQLYRRYFEFVVSYANTLLMDLPLAEDIAQEVFIIMLKKSEQYKSEKGPFQPYLARIVRNTVYMQFRRKGMQITFDDLPEEYPDFIDNNLPIDSILNNECAENVKSVLNLLPPPQREVLYLKYFEDCSLKEIANIVESSVNVVKQMLHRGKVNFKKKYLMFDENIKQISEVR